MAQLIDRFSRLSELLDMAVIRIHRVISFDGSIILLSVFVLLVSVMGIDVVPAANCRAFLL